MNVLFYCKRKRKYKMGTVLNFSEQQDFLALTLVPGKAYTAAVTQFILNKKR